MTRARELAKVSTAYETGGAFGHRNKLINGCMRINQRAASVTANTSTSGAYITDRFRQVVTAGTGVFTVAQDTSAPSGFTNSLKVTVTTAYSVTGTDRYEISQLVEGLNIIDLAWGTADAKPVSLQFWVKSSVTGTFGGVIQNAGADYNCPISYSISSANTWEFKTITISGPTTGTWATDNTQGLKVTWSLGCGSTRLGTAGTWSATRYEGATGQTQLIATNAATWYMTGAQLEAGRVSTPFEMRSYGAELALCQRYFYTIVGGGNTRHAIAGNGSLSQSFPVATFKVSMRTTPTFSYSSLSHFVLEGLSVGGQSTPTAISYNSGTTECMGLNCTSGGSGTGQATQLLGSDANAKTNFSAEL